MHKFMNVAVVATLLVMTACSDNNGSGAAAAPTPPKNVELLKAATGPIVVLGDSLAEGSGAATQTYVPQECIARHVNLDTLDYATPGLTSQEILAQVPQVKALSPRIVFLSSGGNDAITNYYNPNSYSAQKTLSEMTQIFDELLASGAVVIYLGLQPPHPGTERLPQISQVAAQKGVLVLDGMSGLWSNPQLMSDQFHPNEAGYKILCERLQNSLDSLGI